MTTIGFFDSNYTMLARMKGEKVLFAPIHRPNAEQTTALKVDGVIVARMEDVAGLRWAVEAKLVEILEPELVHKNELTYKGKQFAAHHIGVGIPWRT